MDSSWVIAGCAVAACVTTIILQWVRYENRLTKVNAEAENALHVAAEVEQEVSASIEKIATLRQDSADARDRMRREFGETVSAMQHKIHDMETWSRDEFVRKKSFEEFLSRMEKAQEQRDERLDKRLERMENKLDEAAAGGRAAQC